MPALIPVLRALAIVAAVSLPALAQPARGLKVFISVDVEGLAGVVSGSEVSAGTPFIGNEFRTMLGHRGNGIPEERFHNFVYQPISETDGSVSGICVHAVDVTELVQARRDAETARAAAEDANRAKASSSPP